MSVYLSQLCIASLGLAGHRPNLSLVTVVRSAVDCICKAAARCTATLPVRLITFLSHPNLLRPADPTQLNGYDQHRDHWERCAKQVANLSYEVHICVLQQDSLRHGGFSSKLPLIPQKEIKSKDPGSQLRSIKLIREWHAWQGKATVLHRTTPLDHCITIQCLSQSRCTRA